MFPSRSNLDILYLPQNSFWCFKAMTERYVNRNEKEINLDLMADRIVTKEQTEADARATPCAWNGFRSPYSCLTESLIICIKELQRF